MSNTHARRRQQQQQQNNGGGVGGNSGTGPDSAFLAQRGGTPHSYLGSFTCPQKLQFCTQTCCLSPTEADDKLPNAAELHSPHIFITLAFAFPSLLPAARLLQIHSLGSESPGSINITTERLSPGLVQ